MSDYSCFNCNRTNHTSELNRVEWRGLVSLLCNNCISKIFISETEEDLEAKSEVGK